MNTLALFPIAGALTLYGSAFFGVWTAPGLENLPTYEVAMEHAPWSTSEKPDPLAGITAVPSNQQFQPEGVTYDWGDRPVIILPKPEQKKSRGKAPAPTPKVAIARTNHRPLKPLPISPPAFPPAKSVAGRSGSGNFRSTTSFSTGGSYNPRASSTSRQSYSGVRATSSGRTSGRTVTNSYGGR